LVKQAECSDEYIGIKDLLNEKEYNNINNKIETLNKCLDFVSVEMVIHRKKYITQEMIQLLLYEKVSKDKLKDTELNTDYYGRDGRSPLRMDLNLIISEIAELLILFQNTSFDINPDSVHNTRTTRSNYNTDFIYKNCYIEVQSSFKEISKILMKEAKYNGILKLYNNDEPIYILQQKINKDGSTLYKIVDIRKIIKGKTVCRFSMKPEFEIDNEGEWLPLNELKIGA